MIRYRTSSIQGDVKSEQCSAKCMLRTFAILFALCIQISSSLYSQYLTRFCWNPTQTVFSAAPNSCWQSREVLEKVFFLVKGHYCPEDTTTPIACPAGTYNPSTGGQNITACIDCSVGKYCPSEGMDSDGLQCDPGGFTCRVGRLMLSLQTS